MVAKCENCQLRFDPETIHWCSVGEESANDRIRRETATVLLAGILGRAAPRPGLEDVIDAMRQADALLTRLKLERM